MTYAELKEAHDTLRVPSRHSLFQPTADDESFLGSIQLEGVGAIFDMIRCAKPLDYPAVRFEMSQWLDYNNTSGDRHLPTQWREQAARQVKQALQYLEMREKEMFPGNKSFYRCQVEKLEMPVEDDREYLVISDDEDEPEICAPSLPPLADPKGKGKEILDETASEQAVREAAGILDDDDELLGL